MSKTRRKFTAEQKAAIVRRHLKDKEPISSIVSGLLVVAISEDICFAGTGHWQAA